ncbi:fasciclin domain-containing protein [Sphingomonas sp. URHD0057]|uniref:fasciclin domain-containing protein n=1 Tax=Sphingomonas sp. URHD0057 TaxID=1380389 RepID=UPI000685227E|nr:fasciclin domain-containing protein [Sphingomonas sp. URHD0057]
MKSHALMLGVATAAFVVVGGCNNTSANKSETAQTPAAKKVAGDKTIAAGLAANGKFMAAAKSAGLDQTLAGPGPYTVFVPDDAAIDAAPAGTFDAKPDNRAQLTGVLTNLIISGTVMAADIGKAIDAGKGKALLGTMGGGTLIATKDGDKIVLTDSAGHKATVTQADEVFSNGVVHHVDAALLPAKGQPAKLAVGQKAG